ncbi:MAG: PIN domain-containing protein, partial [Bacteroidota bacterium]
MKLFIDVNVLVSVLNKEYPVFTHAARILSLAGQNYHQLYTSPLCIAIAFYFATKKSGQQQAKKKIRILTQHLHIAPCLEDGVEKTVNNPKILDMEDGIQYYAALEAGCTTIITEDLNDFWFSEVEILNCE